MIYNGENQVPSLMVGDMGVKSVKVGNVPIYDRPGSYVYIKLETAQRKGE